MTSDLTRSLPRLGLFVVLVLACLGWRPAPSLAACTGNAIVCENAQPGADPSTWQVQGAGDDTIQGFGTAMSVNKGQTINFKINSTTPAFHIDILRVGYYGGKGARLMQGGIAPTGSSSQPDCLNDANSPNPTGLIDCGNWSVTSSWTVPSDAVSGVYIAHLVQNVSKDDSQIVFIVRDDTSHSDVLMYTEDATWQAYNTFGGNDLYQCTVACPDGNPLAYKAAYKVSYNRPFLTGGADGGRSFLFGGGEYPMIRFLEQNGYDVSYMSSADVANRAPLLVNHKLIVASGHDEYWSASQRSSLEAARDAGVNEAYFTGNEAFWKTRWEPSIDGSSTADRTLVSYKDTHFNQPADPVSWTGTWRDPRFTSAASNTPENSITGQLFVVNSGTSRIEVPQAYGQLRMWRNTDAATLPSGGVLALAPDTLGYEWDVDADTGYRPAGSFRVSSTTRSNLEIFTDYGSTTVFGGTATHNMTMYKAASGARVFGAGTVQWAWGLSDQNPNDSPADRNMEQATVNLFADMDAQPGSLLTGLTAASRTTDTTAPTSTVASLPATVTDGTPMTITGTATDAGGGNVAGVEVSTDGGGTWHPAAGTTSWTYSWTAHGTPSATIRTRAVDDSGNLETPGAGTALGVTCPCSLWGSSYVPPNVSAPEAVPVEVGVKFKADKFGTISGIRFYKMSTNTGTHIGNLWTETGQRLATATFSGETASGWQTVTFSSPVQVLPNTTYIASYYAPVGRYAATPNYFYRSPAPAPSGGAIVDSGPLHALQNTGATTNGVYAYGASSTFPSNSFGAANYWVDVLYTPMPVPGTVTGVSATSAGLTSARVSWTAPAGGGAVTTYRITPYIGATAQTPTTVDAPASSATITGLSNGTTYTFKVEAVNPNGSGPASSASNAVTPLVPVVPSAPSGVLARPGTSSVQVGWTAASSDGDSAISSQTVTPYIGSTPQAPVQVGASATSATVTGLTNGTSYSFRVTATNGVGTSPASAASNSVTPQTTLFDFATPATIDANDPWPVELGVKFKADYDGFITGVRFYKAAANTGAHIGNLWTNTGTRLATATFTNESASGWQTVTFADPVAVTAGTTYVASYFTSTGHPSATGFGLTSAVDHGPLHSVASSVSGNGVYASSAASTFPSLSYNATNYYVDVMFALPAPGQVTGVSAIEAGRTSATVNWSAPASGGPVTSYRVTPYIGSAAQTPTIVDAANTSATIAGLTNGSTYTFKVEAVNANGSGPASAASNAVTPLVPVVPSAPSAALARPASGSVQLSWKAATGDGDSAITSQKITPYIGSTAQTPVQVSASATSAVVTGLSNGRTYTFKVAATNAVGTGPASAASNAVTPQSTIFDFGTPAVVDAGDPYPVELGVKFKADFDGFITGIRFYKSAANTGTHIGNLWTAGGTKLASATFSNESASGWQTVTFADPVAVTAATTYVASYFTPSGHPSVTSSGFSAAVDNGPLHGLADGSSSNGVFSSGATSSFPTDSYHATNYWVDVTYAVPQPGQVTGVTAIEAGKTSANVSWSAPAGGGPVASYRVTPYVGSVAQTPKTVAAPATSTAVTGLTNGTTYSFKVEAVNPDGSGPASDPSNAVTPLGPVVPSAPSGVAAIAATSSARVTWTPAEADGDSAITGQTITPYAGSTPQTPLHVGASATSATVTGLTNGTGYTFTVSATNAVGAGPESANSAAVTPEVTIFDFGTPATVDAGDPFPVELGLKFKADVSGAVTGIRFYKAAANTGAHIGNLWAADGTKLASATFSNESASGWQTVKFATPVAVTAGTTYVASYFTPSGHPSVTGFGLSLAVDNGVLHSLANSVSGNGVYSSGATSAFPTSSYNATNYWVDVLFQPGS